MELFSNGWFPYLSAYIIHCCKRQKLPNTLAYYDMVIITAVKSFIVQIAVPHGYTKLSLRRETKGRRLEVIFYIRETTSYRQSLV